MIISSNVELFILVTFPYMRVFRNKSKFAILAWEWIQWTSFRKNSIKKQIQTSLLSRSMQHAITSENRPVETKVGHVQLLQRYFYWQVMLKNIELGKSIPRNNSLPIHTIPFVDMSQLTQEVQDWSPMNKTGKFQCKFIERKSEEKVYVWLHSMRTSQENSM